jgi:hypothetical protein
MQDLEKEIQKHAAGHHTLHLYEFGKFATSYLYELKAMAACLDPIFDISSHRRVNGHASSSNNSSSNSNLNGNNKGSGSSPDSNSDNGDLPERSKSNAARVIKEIPTLAYFFDNEYIFFRDLLDEIETICSEVCLYSLCANVYTCMCVNTVCTANE